MLFFTDFDKMAGHKTRNFYNIMTQISQRAITKFTSNTTLRPSPENSNITSEKKGKKKLTKYELNYSDKNFLSCDLS